MKNENTGMFQYLDVVTAMGPSQPRLCSCIQVTCFLGHLPYFCPCPLECEMSDQQASLDLNLDISVMSEMVSLDSLDIPNPATNDMFSNSPCPQRICLRARKGRTRAVPWVLGTTLTPAPTQRICCPAWSPRF